MRSLCPLGAAALALAVAPLAAAAPLKPITGKLDRPGYTLIALATTGEARTTLARDGSFSVVPPTATSTLHLRAPDGSYSGPIVLPERTDGVARAKAAVRKATRALRAARTVRQRRRAKAALAKARRALTAARKVAAARPHRVIVGVRAGAQLGTIAVDLAKGYARTRIFSVRHFKNAAAPARQAQGTMGVPLGAGNFGLVRSPRTNGAALGDTDLDAVPNTLDVDDDGDLILDDYDQASAAARAAQLGATFADGSHLQLTTALGAHLAKHGVNANGGSSEEQIAAIQRSQGVLEFLWKGIDDGSGEIDCGTLTYCSTGGTGAFGLNSVPPAGSRDDVQPFPGSFDADGDGFGSLIAGGPKSVIAAPGSSIMGIYHGATADEIRAGDVLIEHGTVGGVPQESASSVGFVFATFPVVAAYSDGQGNSDTFTYPLSENQKAPVRADANGDVKLRLTLWRPQRLRLASEPGTGRWMDVGNLAYTIYVGGGSTNANCQQSFYSEPSETLAVPTSSPMGGIDSTAGGYRDQAADQPANPANTISFTLDLTACLAAKGQTLPNGQSTTLGITAVASGRDGNLFFTSSWWSVRREA